MVLYHSYSVRQLVISRPQATGGTEYSAQAYFKAQKEKWVKKAEEELGNRGGVLCSARQACER